MARQPSTEEIEAVLECARYGDEGDLADIQTFVEAFGPSSLSTAKDERGNTCLHMACANGHADIVEYLLEKMDASSLEQTNESRSTALHWAAINFHLPVLRLLCPKLPEDAFKVTNEHGKTAYDEARERCEAFAVGPEEEGKGGQSERANERIRREVVVGYLQGFNETQPAPQEDEATPAVDKLKLDDKS